MVRSDLLQDKDTIDLLVNMADQFKMPFTQIKYAAELLGKTRETAEQSELINTINQASVSALNLIDSYLLNVELGRYSQLELEPVSLGSVAYDVARSLDSFATIRNCQLEVRVAGRYGPVMANERAVISAFRCLGYSFIEAVSRSEKRSTIVLNIKKHSKGLSTGMFADINLPGSLLRQARSLRGKAHQPLSELEAGPGAGVFIADELVNKLGSELKVAKSKGRSGLTFTLQPSRQLSLV